MSDFLFYKNRRRECKCKMARKRDPRRDEAFEIWKQHNGEITNRLIAEQLDIPEKTISAWKSRDKWNAVLQKDECSTTNKNLLKKHELQLRNLQLKMITKLLNLQKDNGFFVYIM